MSKHHDGLVVADTSPDQVYITTEGARPRALARVMHAAEDGPGNLARMVAAWNHCHGVPTDLLHAGGAAEQRAVLMACASKIDELNGLLKEARKIIHASSARPLAKDWQTRAVAALKGSK